MMKGGYTGKILRINLTNKTIGKIDTEKYIEFGGGHGMGSAIFFDLVGDQLPFEAFDERNLIIMMTSPIFRHIHARFRQVRGAGAWPHALPHRVVRPQQFWRKFTAQLKFAGWDGIVVEGASSEPVMAQYH
jgi:aldehyde:ferredoxin oxidoreductase